MPEVLLNGVQVRFPFEPYGVQTTYMTKVIECLQNGTNGILESPTGTGKTLCLLCSSLAWLETTKAKFSAMRQESSSAPASLSMQLAGAVGQSWQDVRMVPPKIIYSSRTHSQLSQAISELKRTTYKYMKVSVVGSRDQMCVHPEVSKETNNNSKVYMCQMRVKAKTCHYYNQVDNKKDDSELRKDILDIEDLVKMGKKRAFCPYYMSRELKRDSDIIFMPYNYLLDPKTRKAHGVELEGNIVIFDEAHNVEKMCEEAASHQFTSTDLALCIDEVTQVMKKIQENHDASDAAAAVADSSQDLPDFLANDLYTLKALFLELEKAIDSIPLPADGSGSSHSGDYMFEILEKADITPNKKTVIVELLEKLIQYLTVNSSSPFQRKGAGLQKFLDLIYIVYSKDCFSLEQMQSVKRSYKVHVSIEEPKKKGGQQDVWHVPKPVSSKSGRVISYWCFHPGFGMQSLVEQGAKCVILTSGTLSPLDSFASELQVPFPVQLENPHIIKRHQVWAGVVCHGPDGMNLNSSFKNRSDPRYKRSLGQTIVNLARVIPDGLLVFFPSYTVMKDCQEDWQTSGVWSRLSEIKPIFVEPKTKDEFQTAMQEYYEKIKDPAFMGACFMAVCRGKVSEGLDFADCNGRAVIITGLPYPPFKDPRVVLKQKYLEEARTRRKHGLTGQAWYNLEASRAVNQAVGRVIRHKDDFGAIVLCDSRFASTHFKGQLSSWIRPHIMNYNKFGPVIREITQFFKQAQILLPCSKGEKKCAPARTIKHEESNPSRSYPVTAHGLESISSRSVNSQNTSKHSMEHQNTVDSPLETISDLNYPPSEETKKDVRNASESIFTLLEQEVKVKPKEITFSAPPPPLPDYLSIKMNSKRRKIKLVPRIGIPGEGSEGVSEHVLRPPNPETSVSSGSDKVDKHSKLCQPTELEGNKMKNASEKEEEKKRKLKATGAYIMEVKAAVSKEKYAVFSSAIKEYKNRSDFKKLLNVIPTIFSNDPAQQALMKKFQHFLKPEDREKFEAFVADTSQT
uniref:Regulator of telomere elongation helicase 1 homolog n=1 Tax=Scylla olivacea TaxID=85551 RepID=A0A0P4WD16_SCYOL